MNSNYDQAIAARLKVIEESIRECRSLLLNILQAEETRQEQPPGFKPGLNTYQEAADKLKIKKRTLQQWVAQKRIDVVDFGRITYITNLAIDRFIERSTRKSYYKSK